MSFSSSLVVWLWKVGRLWCRLVLSVTIVVARISSCNFIWM